MARDHGHRCPLRCNFRQKFAAAICCMPIRYKQGGELPQQRRPLHRNCSQTDKFADQIVKDSGLHLKPKEICIVRKESGVQSLFDGVKVNAVVFKPG